MTKFEPGKYRTRDGREAEVYRTDGCGAHSIIGAVKHRDGWRVCTWQLNGKTVPNAEHNTDLMPPTPKASGFVNVYEDRLTSRSVHVDRVDANDFAINRSRGNKRVACIDLSQIDLTPFLVEDEE
jgi:hypothetical protein